MTAIELYLLGRKLVKIAEAEFPETGTGAAPASVRMILFDVSENPDSSIGEIAIRCGFPQSHVSTSVARLRDLGALRTEVDQADGRRTLVRLTPGMRRWVASRTSISIDEVLAAELNGQDARALDEVNAALDVLAQRLIPRALRFLRSDPASRKHAKQVTHTRTESPARSTAARARRES